MNFRAFHVFSLSSPSHLARLSEIVSNVTCCVTLHDEGGNGKALCFNKI